MTEAEVLLDQYRQLILNESKSPQQCLDDEYACNFPAHPMRTYWGKDGKDVCIAFDLEAATPLLLAAAWRIAAEYIRDFHGEYGAAEKLGRLANEVQGVRT